MDEVWTKQTFATLASTTGFGGLRHLILWKKRYSICLFGGAFDKNASVDGNVDFSSPLAALTFPTRNYG
jgi:hypothetical protein